MPTRAHRQTAPPPCNCDGCTEQRVILTRLCPELPAGARDAKRDADRREQRMLEETSLSQPMLRAV